MKKSEIREIIREELLKERSVRLNELSGNVKKLKLKKLPNINLVVSKDGKSGMIMQGGSAIAEFDLIPNNPFFIKSKKQQNNEVLNYLVDAIRTYGK